MSRRQNTFRIFGYCILLLEGPPAGIHSIPMATKKRVLFICTGNSARSQMAEGILRHLAGDQYEVFSAGTSPKGMHPKTVEVMKEIGIDVTQQISKDLTGFLDEHFDHVITVCGRARQQCPI